MNPEPSKIERLTKKTEPATQSLNPTPNRRGFAYAEAHTNPEDPNHALELYFQYPEVPNPRPETC